MTGIFQTIEIVSGLVMMMTILLQHRGTGLGGAFGGADTAYRSRRGIEQLLFRLTIVLATIFVLSALAQLIVV